MLIQLINPVLQVLECLVVSGVVDEADCSGVLVVNLGDATELLTACSVPNLQTHFGGDRDAQGLHRLDLGHVVAAHSGLRRVQRIIQVEGGFVILLEDTRFTNSRLPQHHNLVVLDFILSLTFCH